MSASALRALVVIPLVVLAACSPKLPSGPELGPKRELVSDSDPDRVRVTMVKNEAAPLTVDWNFEHRKSLESRMRRGTIVVSFTAKKLAVLPECNAPGKYAFVGSSPGRGYAAAHTAAELEANFPFSAASLRGRLANEGALVADLRPVGTSNLDQPKVLRTDLQGAACTEATHYVVEVLHGGFVFGSSSAVEAAAKAGFMGMGASAATQSSASHVEQEGVLAECDKADASATTPPGKCAGILRIRMLPLEAVSERLETPSCGEGLRWNGVACASEARVAKAAPAPAAPTRAEVPTQAASADKPDGFACDGKDLADCWQQCKAGNADSCAMTGTFFQLGAGGAKRDMKTASSLYEVACKAGSRKGCTFLGAFYIDEKRYPDAVAASRKACDAGEPGGCTNLGFMLYNGLGVAKDRPKAYELYTRACKRREWASCNNAGVMVTFATGGVTADPPAGCRMFAQACEATNKEIGCANLALCIENGIGHPRDANKALELYVDSCNRRSAFACVWGGLLFESRGRDKATVGKALAAYEAACDFPDPGYCVSTSEIMTALPGSYDLDMIDRRACDGGDQRGLACYNAALVYERGLGGIAKDIGKANALLKKACKQYDTKKACRPAGVLPN
ncbi:MAG: SEL1-like repeat protein [Labilithrix sp.]|nr:SEL1-like repeat protein [Labilithrix sp.]